MAAKTPPPPPKGFWASIKDTLGIGLTPEEKEKREETFARGIAAMWLLSDDLAPKIDRVGSPEEKLRLANMFLDPSVDLDKELRRLKREDARLRKEEKVANQPVSPEEEYRRKMERDAQEHFGKIAAIQSVGQQRLADLKKRSSGLSPQEIERETQNINDWVQRKIDEL